MVISIQILTWFLAFRFENRRHTSIAMNRNYSETHQMSIPADKNNKPIILDVGGKKHKIRSEYLYFNPCMLRDYQEMEKAPLY